MLQGPDDSDAAKGDWYTMFANAKMRRISASYGVTTEKERRKKERNEKRHELPDAPTGAGSLATCGRRTSEGRSGRG